MTDRWMTYAELGELLNCSPEGARQKAIRKKWRRQTGNDGRARVLVPPDLETPVQTPSERPHKSRPDAREAEALRELVSTLKEQLAKIEALADQRRAEVEHERNRMAELRVQMERLEELSHRRRLELDRERDRVAELTAEVLRLSTRLANAETARANAEIEALRSRPWWRRVFSR